LHLHLPIQSVPITIAVVSAITPGALDSCDKVCQRLTAGWWIS